MASHLRRWGLELAASALIACFLFNGVLYSMCVHYRPRTLLPEKGWISPVTTKFGTCYTSAFESLMQRHFFAVSIPIFIVAFVLTLTYREGWILGRSIGDNLRNQRALPIRLTQTPTRASGCLWKIRGT